MESVTYPIGPVDAGCCLWCGETARESPSGKAGKWCSKSCDGKARLFRRDILGPWCSSEGCGRGVLAGGLCPTHYSSRYRKTAGTYNYDCTQCGKSVKSGRKPTSDSGNRFCSKECSMTWNNDNLDRSSWNVSEVALHSIVCPECGETFEYRGSGAPKYCGSNCLRSYQYSQRSNMRRCYESGDSAGFIESVRERSELTTSGCWEWQGGLSKDRYSVIRMGRKRILVYRAVLEAKEGAPLGSQAAHHKCANSKCVNPDHLQPVTHRENTAEMLARKSLTDRIRELEVALGEVSPGHDLLKVVPVM